MNSLVNKVHLIGNLGKDFEIKEFENGKKLAKGSMATTAYFKNAEGERVSDTQWHNLIAWGKLGEIMEQYTQKGSKVAIDGKIEYSSYEDKEGAKKVYTQIVVNDFLNLTKKEELPF